METAAFQKGANIAEKRMAGLQKKFANVGDRMSGIGRKMSLSITAPFVGLMATAIPAATAARDAMAQVEAGLKGMGSASGKTADELQKSAKALQSVSTFNKNDILRKVTANLITFGSVSGENFDRAQQAAIDLATRMKMDLQPATVMIGKALNDPILGLTAMRRVGIQFTEAQQDMIKGMVEAGDVAGAQAVMLGELERQFGGSAKAAREAAPGSDTIDAWRQFQETIGEIALKVLPPLTNMLTKVLDAFNNLSPATQAMVLGAVAFAAAVGPLLMVLGPMVKLVGAMLPLIVKLGPAFAVLRVAMLAIFANPIILGAALLIGGIYLTWKNWDKISEIVQRVYQAVKTWLLDKLQAVVDGVKKKIEAVTGFFKNMYDRVVGNSIIPDMIDGIAYHFGRLHEEMVKPATVAIGELMMAFGDLAAQGVDDFANAIADAITGTKSMAKAFGDMARQIIHDIIRMSIRMLAFRALAGVFGGLFGGVPSGNFGVNPTGGAVGMARGGSGTFGGFSGVDKNVLSLNGSPIARVSKGEHFQVTPANDRGSGEITINQTYSFQGVAVTQQEFARGLMFAKHDTIATLKDMNRRR